MKHFRLGYWFTELRIDFKNCFNTYCLLLLNNQLLIESCIYDVICLMRVEDVLSEDKDECVICLELLAQGDAIARLPCLCIYHKRYQRFATTYKICLMYSGGV